MDSVPQYAQDSVPIDDTNASKQPLGFDLITHIPAVDSEQDCNEAVDGVMKIMNSMRTS